MLHKEHRTSWPLVTMKYKTFSKTFFQNHVKDVVRSIIEIVRHRTILGVFRFGNVGVVRLGAGNDSIGFGTFCNRDVPGFQANKPCPSQVGGDIKFPTHSGNSTASQWLRHKVHWIWDPQIWGFMVQAGCKLMVSGRLGGWGGGIPFSHYPEDLTVVRCSEFSENFVGPGMGLDHHMGTIQVLQHL